MFFCQTHNISVAPETCGMFFGCPQDCQQRRGGVVESVQRRRSDDPRMEVLGELQRLYERRRDVQTEIRMRLDELVEMEG